MVEVDHRVSSWGKESGSFFFCSSKLLPECPVGSQNACVGETNNTKMFLLLGDSLSV